MTIFQSYLFVGNTENTREQTQKLSKKLAIDLSPSSPDITIISPKKSSISIDQIRDMKKYIFQKPFSNSYKLVIIENAQMLTIPAQNAFLKILEEPPKHALIILEATNKESLLATIRSRVVTKSIISKNESLKKSLFLTKGANLSDLLITASDIDNPSEWLNTQIISLHRQLLQSIEKNQLESSVKVSALIGQCAQAKLMIEANVNPKFVLFNLVFHLNSKPCLPAGRSNP